MAQITHQMLRSLPGSSNHSLDHSLIAQITPQTLRLQVLLCSACSIRLPRSLPRNSNHVQISPDPQITSLACSFRFLRSLPRRSNHAQITLQTFRLQVLLVHFDCSDHSPDAQITSKSYSRPSDYKSCYDIYACSFRLPRSLPRR